MCLRHTGTVMGSSASGFLLRSAERCLSRTGPCLPGINRQLAARPEPEALPARFLSAVTTALAATYCWTSAPTGVLEATWT